MAIILNLNKIGGWGEEEGDRREREKQSDFFFFFPVLVLCWFLSLGVFCFFGFCCCWFYAYVLLIWKRNRKGRMCKNRCGSTKPPHRLLEKEDVHKEQSVWPLKYKLIQKEDMKKCYSKHIIHCKSWDVYDYPRVAGN